ncbi:GntR family transcriptional regulator [Glycomyces sp. A-F 0318]|uniref:GntR family transcriptional regulator n=1 Tax=Glycomyces amatae TaxID=2881355 RepID=UPI001E600BEA|nr:GntR family transcriptional regulator [Glycomyces amatae]MCD0442409.1 GntR family transcriptional regulator [Glycomyces amatae]
MRLTLDVDSEIPIYQQIRDQIVAAIAAGELAAEAPLPSTRQLGAALAINFHTVNKAYDLLRREGFIRVNRKSGAVVRRGPDSGPPDPGVAEAWQERLRVLLAEAVAHGLTAEEVLRRSGDVLASFDRAPADTAERTTP